MPIDVKWYIPYRVISVEGTGELRVYDLEVYNDAIMQLLIEAQEHAPGRLIYNLFDATYVESYPPIYLMVSRALPVLRFKNRGPLFLITQSRAIRSLFELTSHIMDFSVRAFASREDAIKALDVALAKDDLRSAKE